MIIFCVWDIYKNFWTEYQIDNDTIIWIRRLEGGGNVIAKAKNISDFKKINKKIKKIRY